MLFLERICTPLTAAAAWNQCWDHASPLGVATGALVVAAVTRWAWAQTSRTENKEVSLAAVNRRVVGSSPTRGATRFHIEVGASLVNGAIAHFWGNWPE